MTITKITDHFERAKEHLIEQDKNKQNIEKYIKVLSAEIQELENVFFDVLEKRRLDQAQDAQLDGVGDILNVQRGGLADDEYKSLIYTKIAEYNSECTIEDVNSIFSNLVRADSIRLTEYYPATIQLTAINSDPLILESGIKNAVLAAKAAAVKLDSIIFAESPPFGFAGNPIAKGFGEGKFAKTI